MINYKDLNLSEEELDELQSQLNNRKDRQIYEDNIKQIEAHKKYIGKCFKDKHNKYIRVLSSKSSNTFRFECMCFEFPIIFHEKFNHTLRLNPENAFSRIEFKGIYVEDYPLLCNTIGGKAGKTINSLEEISEEEYFSKMHEYIDILEEMVKNNEFDTSKKNKSIFEG